VPRYDFRCSFCGPFERIVSIRETTDTATCPDCGEAGTRVFGSPQLFSRTSPVRRALAAECDGAYPVRRP
jgi:putative FmdB family regulatory protein